MRPHKKTLHIFRRDLRIHDNIALLKALETSEQVLACFIFDPRQIKKHAYQSTPALQFMLESLQDLSNAIAQQGGRLYFFSGKPEEVLEQLKKEKNIDCVSWNRDYTPFSLQRDKAMQKFCKKHDIAVIEEHDVLLNEPGKILTGSGTPYKVYTPFKHRSKEFPVNKPVKNTAKNYFLGKVKCDKGNNYLDELQKTYSEKYIIKGGREQGKKLLKKVKKLTDYKELRDIPKENYTSHLSAHHKFGTLSIREVYHFVAHHFGPAHPFISELYWRDFFTHVGFHFPRVFKGAFTEKYNALQWSQSKTNFAAWCEGKTGYPIVDAGMRELNKTGYMHNRVRMITASFLVKDLHINWQWGETYFAQKLIDYDPAVNNGNWQWAASIGCDAQPYFRIFNPWRQTEKFDKDCEYIKTWIPELRELEAKTILKLEKHDVPEGINYPNKIVQHKEAAKKAKEMFWSIS